MSIKEEDIKVGLRVLRPLLGICTVQGIYKHEDKVLVSSRFGDKKIDKRLFLEYSLIVREENDEK